MHLSPTSKLGAYVRALVWNAATIAAQILCYRIASGVTLLGDIFHASTDLIALSATTAVFWLAAQGQDPKGILERIAFVGAVALLAIGGMIVASEAIERFAHPFALPWQILAVGALIGVGGNLMAHRALSGVEAHDHDRLHTVTHDHVRMDLLTSGVVLVAALATGAFGWTFIDPLFALATACIMIALAWKRWHERHTPHVH